MINSKDSFFVSKTYRQPPTSARTFRERPSLPLSFKNKPRKERSNLSLVSKKVEETNVQCIKCDSLNAQLKHLKEENIRIKKLLKIIYKSNENKNQSLERLSIENRILSEEKRPTDIIRLKQNILNYSNVKSRNVNVNHQLKSNSSISKKLDDRQYSSNKDFKKHIREISNFLDEQPSNARQKYINNIQHNIAGMAFKVRKASDPNKLDELSPDFNERLITENSKVFYFFKKITGSFGLFHEYLKDINEAGEELLFKSIRIILVSSKY